MNLISKRILQAHAWFLLLFPLAMTAGTFAGFRLGIGPANWIQPHPVAMIGIIQAYLLMSLVGGLALRDSLRNPTPASHLFLVLAHCVPLTAFLTLWDVFEAHGITDLTKFSLPIHLPWITVELILYFYDKRTAPGRAKLTAKRV